MVAAIIASVALAAPSNFDPADDFRAALNSWGKEGLHGAVLVLHDGSEIFWHGVGQADWQKKRAFTRDSVFDVGSIVKPMVKAAAIKLATTGKIALDDSIGKYFEDVPPEKRVITIQMLMDHRSGFRDVFGGDFQPIERDELMRKMLDSELIFAPGTQEEYSNSGYSMLSTILEKASGKSIERLIADNQFKPIGVTKTGYTIPEWNESNLVSGYRMNGLRFGTPLEQQWMDDGPSWHLRGNGGMLATLPELGKWFWALHSGKLLSKAEYEKFVPVWADGFSERSLMVDAGGNGVYNTVIGYSPSRKLIILAASTSSAFRAESKMREMIGFATALVDGTPSRQ